MNKQNAYIVHETWVRGLTPQVELEPVSAGPPPPLAGPFGERRLDGPFASKEKADAAAERWREQGIDAHVVALPRW